MNNPLKEKSFRLAVRIVKLSQWLVKEKKEFVLSKQVLRSGTAIGALYREAEHAESKADFAHKLCIAQKETNETLYWLELLKETEYLDAKQFQSLHNDTTEVIKLLTAIIKSSKANN